jgi:hypothetical protein
MKPLEKEEKQRTLDALESCGWNMAAAARILALPRTTVQSRAYELRKEPAAQTPAVDPKLAEWGTARQGEYIEAVIAHGSVAAAARALGKDESVLRRSVESLKQGAAKRGYSPEHDLTHPVPAPFVVRGTSTLYDEDGKARMQWVKTKLDDVRLEESIRLAIETLSEDMPRALPVPKPKKAHAELANLFTLSDTHIGAKAWAEECGEDWDLNIAEKTISNAFLYLIQAVPPAKVGIINFLGDLMHYDSLDAVTPQHRNLLDADSRYPKMVQVAVRVLRRVIDAVLERHEEVVVSLQEGNHDLASSVWLRHLFSLLYENEPRLTVLDDINPYSVVQHGKTMLAFHHGHLAKNAALPSIFAANFAPVWGATTYRYCHVGHRHHVEEKEDGGMIVIQHPTLAARDAYSTRLGHASQRSATAITYHKEFGQVARSTVVPDMLL